MMVKVLNMLLELSSLAVPRSMRQALPWWSITEFQGLMSRQMMLLACRYSTDSMMHPKQQRAIGLLRVGIQRMTSNISLPRRYSIKRKMFCESWKACTKPTINGKTAFSKIFFYSMTLSSICSYLTAALEMHLTAYNPPPVCLFFTRWTCPNCPSPNLRTNSKSARVNLLSFYGMHLWEALKSRCLFQIDLTISFSFSKDKYPMYPALFFTKFQPFYEPFSHLSILNKVPYGWLLIPPYKAITSPLYFEPYIFQPSSMKTLSKPMIMLFISAELQAQKLGTLIKDHFWMLKKRRFFKLEPKAFSISFLPITRQVVSYRHLAEPCLLPLSLRALSPNISVRPTVIGCLPVKLIQTRPSETMKSPLDTSPALKMVSPCLKEVILMEFARLNFCLLVKH